MAAKENRIVITLACTDCRSRNYTASKNRIKHPDRLEFRKYCSTCRKHVGHREQK
jgi:large subunit ribosomal protein L33